MRSAVLLSLLVVACADGAVDPVDYPIVPAHSEVWSGGTLDLVSTGFSGADTVPIFTVGNDTLEVESAGSLRVRITIPDTSGGIDIEVHFADGSSRTAAMVSVFGFDSWQEGPAIGGNPVAVPGTAEFLANGETGLVRFNAQTATAATVLADTLHDPTCTLTPGLSVVAGVTTGQRRLAGGGCRYYAWQNGAVVDSGPSYIRSWTMVHLGSANWLVGNKHRTAWWANGTESDLGAFEEPEQVAISPAGDRIFKMLGSSNNGVPVFNASGQVAYRMTDLGYLNGIVFISPDTAYAVGLNLTFDTLRVQALNPVTGTVYRTLNTSGGFSSMMVLDPNGDYLYLARYAYSSLEVRDRHTFEHVATLRAPATAPAAYNAMISLVAIGANRTAYVVSVPVWDLRPTAMSSRTRVFRYNLLP